MEKQKIILFVSHASQLPAIFMEMHARHWRNHGFKGNLLEGVEFKSAVVSLAVEPTLNFKEINMAFLRGMDLNALGTCTYGKNIRIHGKLINDASLIVAMDERATMFLTELHPSCADKCMTLEKAGPSYDYTQYKEVLYQQMFAHAQTLTHCEWENIAEYLSLVT